MTRKKLARTLRDLVLSVFSSTLREPCAQRPQNLARTLRGQNMWNLQANLEGKVRMYVHRTCMQVLHQCANLARSLREPCALKLDSEHASTWDPCAADASCTRNDAKPLQITAFLTVAPKPCANLARKVKHPNSSKTTICSKNIVGNAS